MTSKFLNITALLIVLHLIVLMGGRNGWGIPEPVGRLFFLDQEYNIPSFYSSFLFLLSGYYCFLFGYKRLYSKRFIALSWSLLGMLLIFFAADEWFGLHEKLIIPLRVALGIESGVFYFAWTIVYIGIVTIVGFLTIPWLRSLEASLRRQLIWSAVIYVTGALVLEMVGSWLYSSNGHIYSVAYANIVTLEESLELIGLTIASMALHKQFNI